MFTPKQIPTHSRLLGPDPDARESRPMITDVFTDTGSARKQENVKYTHTVS